MKLFQISVRIIVFLCKNCRNSCESYQVEEGKKIPDLIRHRIKPLIPEKTILSSYF